MADRLHMITGRRFLGIDAAGSKAKLNGVLLSDGEVRDGRRVWVCSHCGHRDVWGPTWLTYGTMDCVEHVVCSDACRMALHPKAKVLPDIPPPVPRERRR